MRLREMVYDFNPSAREREAAEYEKAVRSIALVPGQPGNRLRKTKPKNNRDT